MRVRGLVRALRRRVRRVLEIPDRLRSRRLARVVEVEARGETLRMAAPTRRLRREMRRLADQEPETRRWIDEIPCDGSAVLWDVGANVGVFSMYAAARGLRVVAVEPAPQNLLLLALNIAKNRCGDRVTLLPTALGEISGVAEMNLSSHEFGSAHHGFGTTETFRGKPTPAALSRFRLAGISIDDAVSTLGLPAPTHIKIDVDGIELLVLHGALTSLRQVAGACVELKHEEQIVGQIVAQLESVGLALVARSSRNGFFSR